MTLPRAFGGLLVSQRPDRRADHRVSCPTPFDGTAVTIGDGQKPL